jgi:hypothetical protein
MYQKYSGEILVGTKSTRWKAVYLKHVARFWMERNGKRSRGNETDREKMNEQTVLLLDVPPPPSAASLDAPTQLPMHHAPAVKPPMLLSASFEPCYYKAPVCLERYF